MCGVWVSLSGGWGGFSFLVRANVTWNRVEGENCWKMREKLDRKKKLEGGNADAPVECDHSLFVQYIFLWHSWVANVSCPGTQSSCRRMDALPACFSTMTSKRRRSQESQGGQGGFSCRLPPPGHLRLDQSGIPRPFSSCTIIMHHPAENK